MYLTDNTHQAAVSFFGGEGEGGVFTSPAKL